MSATDAPVEVVELAEQRAVARAAKDFAASDELRDRIRATGWKVVDGANGWTLTPAPPFDVFDSVQVLPVFEAPTRDVGVGLVIDGWPDDVRICLDALLRWLPPSISIVALDLGDVDGAGQLLHEYAERHPGRIEALHVEQTLDRVGWAAAQVALLKADASEVHIVMDLSTVLDGDAITPLVSAIQGDVVAAGWRGVNVDIDDGWRSFNDGGPGEVDAVLSYLFAVDRQAALATPPHPKARFYRNADLEWSLALRSAGGRIVAPVQADGLPAHQDRHRGYHDSEAAFRDKESKRTYDRILQTFRGRTDLLAPRP